MAIIKTSLSALLILFISISASAKENYQTKLGNDTIRSYAENSLLSNGNWFKIKIDTSGVFKLTYDQLVQIGLTQPKNVRLYSYGGKQLPYENNIENYDDLQEIPVYFSSGSSSSFNNSDYILFYGEGPITWEYNKSLDMFTHKTHHYSKFTYIFLTDQFTSGGLTIKEIDNSSLNANFTTNTTDSYRYYEENKNNLIHSGRIWYGSKMMPGQSESINFLFPNITSDPIKIAASVAGRKQLQKACNFLITTNDNSVDTIIVADNHVYTDYMYAYGYLKSFEVNNPKEINTVKIKFNGATNDMEGYIDYIVVNAQQEIKLSSSQITFCNKKSLTAEGVWQYNINNNGKEITVWDISNSEHPYQLKIKTQGNTSSFKIQANGINHFIAFDGSRYFTPIIESEVKVDNQNLHGTQSTDMVIVSHPDFLEQAERLAQIHRNNDQLKVLVTTPQEVYNEFSSGSPDISAIRNFMRMLYHKSTSNDKIKYLLLFGDGTYDNLGINDANANYIPTYQSMHSLEETASHVSDDYLGLLDIDEGEKTTGGMPRIYGKLDIGIGRIPVEDTVEARQVVDKIEYYINANSAGNWRTNICFIGDDEDGGLHANQPEDIDRTILRTNYPEYNVNKIFLDAYKQISTPSGQRYPDVKDAITKAVDKGALIIDYVGHGSPRILTKEEVLSASEVRRWRNKEKLPLFVTASCEVGRYDNHEDRSLGEWFLLHPDGGGIAALTTTRIVYSGSNDRLNRAFFNNVLNPNLRLGDVVRLAKNELGANEINHRNFSLLGDPALRLAVPENKIFISSINDELMVDNPLAPEEEHTYTPGDTIQALTKTHIEGYIDDYNGNPIYDSGTLYVTIFDKTDTLYSKGNDNNNAVEFLAQNKILYKGKASITDGVFSFDFIVPKDINYKYGKGKISLYAVLDSVDAIGYSDNIIIGGSSDNVEEDYDGPDIELYMNDYGFRNGATTNENPILLAKLTDTTGINTTGNGFGHNITAILDDNQDNVYVLNDYYEGDLDKYNSGEVRFPFFNLESGHHKVDFKVWDIHNNSSESSIEFYVKNAQDLVIENVQNSPNPFFNETYFTFEHNQSDTDFDITIRVFDIMGNKVTELYSKNSNPGYKTNPIYWDGTSSNGAKLPNGIYIYRVEISTPDGKKSYKSSKLMIFK